MDSLYMKFITLMALYSLLNVYTGYYYLMVAPVEFESTLYEF